MKESNQREHVTETPDISYIRNVDTAHELSDVQVGGVVKFVVGLFVMTVAVFFLTWGMFRMFEARSQEPPRSPMALSGEERLPPEPRLQGAPGFGEALEKSATLNEAEASTATRSGNPKNPLWEIQALRKQWEDVLAHGAIDQNGKRIGMPIEEAKEEILKQGLPVRSQAADGRKQ
jgi:hypothetical protein